MRELNASSQIRILDPSEAISAARADWEQNAQRSKSIDALYQSPTWFQHLINTVSVEQLSVLSMDGEIRGSMCLVPLIRKPHTLEFQALGRRLCKFQLNSVQIVGSEPANLGIDPSHAMLLEAILKAYSHCDVVYHNSVFSDSPYGQFLARRPKLGLPVRYYLPEGFRRRHHIVLPDSMSQFLLRFPVKRRHNLKRAAAQMQAECGGDLRLTVVTSEDQTVRFLEVADRINRASWQFRDHGAGLVNETVSLRSLGSAARLGILRSYLIEAGDQPVAYALGYRYRDIYYYVEPRFDPKFSRFSPGQVLLLRLIEDLIAIGGIRRISLGVGDQKYKEQFADVHYEDATILVGRNTISNRIRFGCHSSARLAVNALKRAIGHSDSFRR